MLQNIAVYPTERDVFYREEADGCYSAETFILQYTALEIPFEILSSLVFGVISAYAAKPRTHCPDAVYQLIQLFLHHQLWRIGWCRVLHPILDAGSL